MCMCVGLIGSAHIFVSRRVDLAAPETGDGRSEGQDDGEEPEEELFQEDFP